MIITIVAALIIASVPLTGGRLGRMSELRFRGTWLLMASLAVQLLITIAIVDADATLLAVLHLLSYVLAATFLWRNRTVPGLLVIGAGGMANFAAIGANGGLMPASPRALEIAGIVTEDGFSNSTAVDGARLQVLGDIFAIPAGWPFANVFSIGDVILLVGVGILVHRVSRWPAPVSDPVPVPEPEPGRASASAPTPAGGAATRRSRVDATVALAGRRTAGCCGARRAHRCCTGARRGRSANVGHVADDGEEGARAAEGVLTGSAAS